MLRLWPPWFLSPLHAVERLKNDFFGGRFPLQWGSASAVESQGAFFFGIESLPIKRFSRNPWFSVNAKSWSFLFGTARLCTTGMGCSLGGRQVHPGKDCHSFLRLQLLASVIRALVWQDDMYDGIAKLLVIFCHTPTDVTLQPACFGWVEPSQYTDFSQIPRLLQPMVVFHGWIVVIIYPFPETNSKFAPENGWLEDDPSLSFWDSAYFQGLAPCCGFSFHFFLDKAKSCITLPDMTGPRQEEIVKLSQGLGANGVPPSPVVTNRHEWSDRWSRSVAKNVPQEWTRCTIWSRWGTDSW